jgi:hypothetical protein
MSEVRDKRNMMENAVGRELNENRNGSVTWLVSDSAN